jgi:hypothetical protein
MKQLQKFFLILFTKFKRFGKERIDPFMITVVLHSSGTFVIGKMTISRKNGDVTDAFHCSTTSFYGKGYYYHSRSRDRMVVGFTTTYAISAYYH